MANIEEKVEKLLQEKIQELGYNLYDVEYAKEGANYFCNIKNPNTEYCRHSKQICPVAQYGG